MKKENTRFDLQKEKPYWVAFNHFEGIGPHRLKLLIDYFGSAQKAWEAPRKELLEIGLGEKLVADFDEFRQNFSPKDYFGKLSQKGISVLTLLNKDYPEILKQIPDCPPVLYFKGTLKPEDNLAMAVVGTRKITSYGRQATELLVRDLVAVGLTIVSGMARGVDSMAHQTALASGSRTIAVLGSGVDVIYPPENKKLYEEIVKSGAVISEFPPGYPALPGNFPARNRIISGLALGVLVTEAAEDSGSLITASCAAEQGREVFAVPGPITSPLSQGTAELIKKGAKLVYNVRDILEELNIKSRTKQLRAKTVLPESKEEVLILEILKTDGTVHIDEITRRSGMVSAQVGSVLTLMEIKGMVKNFGNGEYGLLK